MSEKPSDDERRPPARGRLPGTGPTSRRQPPTQPRGRREGPGQEEEDTLERRQQMMRAQNPTRPVMAPLVLSVKTKKGRYEDENAAEADDAFASARMTVANRDKLRCQACTATTIIPRGADRQTSEVMGYLEIHHIDDDHHNNDPSNLIVLCPFCHATQHIGNAGHRDAGWVIYAPFITQENLNLLMHVVFYIRKGRIPFAERESMKEKLEKMSPADKDYSEFKSSIEIQDYVDLADLLYEKFKGMREDADRVYGDGMSDPTNFGYSLMMLYNKSPERYERRAELIGGARYLPNEATHARAIERWYFANKHIAGEPGNYVEFLEQWKKLVS